MPNKVQKQILEKIKEYDRIAIFRHFRPDGDAVGSTKGLQGILRATFPNKDIRLINADYSAYMAFLGPEDDPFSDEELKTALAVVLDTGTVDRISSDRYSLCREIVKIDHHIDDKPYGDISWVEEESSSVCEMITSFWLAFPELQITKEAATALYCGLVTDSGRFRFDGTTPDTFSCAGALLAQGIDMQTIYANLYMEDLDALQFDAMMTRKIRQTENGVSWLYVSQKTQQKYHMSGEQASNTVELMKKIRNSLIWLAFIENTDGTIRVRLRSRFVTVQELATHYHGGGHACASGSTVYSRREMNALIAEADELLKKYKEENEGWL